MTDRRSVKTAFMDGCHAGSGEDKGVPRRGLGASIKGVITREQPVHDVDRLGISFRHPGHSLRFTESSH